MSILYVISTIILFGLAIMVEKSKEKIEITKSIALGSVLMLAYNGFISYILNLINIPITLLSLSVTNLVISILLTIKIVKDKTIQKYTISKTNIIAIALLVIITGSIIAINFGGLSKIRYISMDAREHYKAAREFSENTSLSNKAKENNTVGEAFMFMGYVNAGILFKIFNPYIGTVNLYKIYILFEAFVYLLTGVIFYFILENIWKKQDKKSSIKAKIIGMIFTIIYFLGYPLNAWISGFHYLVLGILSVEGIICVFSTQSKNIKLGYKLIILFLLNFALILSYSLFCPFVYLAEFIYYCFEYKKYRNKIQLFLSTLVTLIIPGIIGVTYLILPSFGTVGSSIAHEGWIYKNLWSNFILFIPFTIYTIYKNIKNKKITFSNIMLLTLALYMGALFVGTKTGRCAEYYFHKNYFILWIMLIYLNTKGMIEFINEEKQKYIIYIYTIIYLLIFGVSTIYQTTYISEKNNDSLNNTMEIFTFNKTMIFAKNAEFITQKDLELLEKTEDVIKNNWQKRDNDILFVISPNKERWLQSLTGYINKLYENKEEAIENLKQEKYKYIVTFEDEASYQYMKENIKTENMKLIYQNEIGKIYESR